MNVKGGILAVIHDSWGEVDWILPVLVAASQRLGVTVHLHFLFEKTLELASEYTDLMRLAQRHTSVSSGQEELKELAGRLTDQASPTWVLHDYSGNDFRQIYEYFPQSRVMVFPHGTSFEYMYYDEARQQAVRDALYYHTIPEAAMFLHCFPTDEAYFRTITSVRNHVVAGCPKFDPWWIELVKKEVCPPDSSEPGYLYLAWPKRKISGEGYYGQMMRSMARSIREKGGGLHLRAHPRQSRAEVIDALGEEAQHVRFLQTSILGGATWAKGIVCAPSCSAMDGISQGVPVVEYFNFTDQDWPSFLNVNDKRTSLCRKHGLVVPANDENELRQAMNDISQPGEAREQIKVRQRAALRELMPEERRATNTIIKIINSAIDG